MVFSCSFLVYTPSSYQYSISKSIFVNFEPHTNENIFLYKKQSFCLRLFFFPVRASQVAPEVKNLPANAGDIINACLIPGLGRSPGVGNGNPLQYCLENPHGVSKSWTQLKHLSTQACLLSLMSHQGCGTLLSFSFT